MYLKDNYFNHCYSIFIEIGMLAINTTSLVVMKYNGCASLRIVLVFNLTLRLCTVRKIYLITRKQLLLIATYMYNTTSLCSEKFY